MISRSRCEAGSSPVSSSRERPGRSRRTENDSSSPSESSCSMPTTSGVGTPSSRACAMTCSSSANHGTGRRAIRTTTGRSSRTSTRYVSCRPPPGRRTSRSTARPQTDRTTESITGRGVVAIIRGSHATTNHAPGNPRRPDLSLPQRVGGGLFVEPGWVGFGVGVPAGWSGGAGDAGGGADDQGAVAQELEGPAGGEGLDPVVGLAQAAEVPAGGGSAAGVGPGVVEVAAADAAAAAGHAAVPVAGGDEAFLGGGGPVGRGVRRRVQPRPVGRAGGQAGFVGRLFCSVGGAAAGWSAAGRGAGPAPAF